MQKCLWESFKTKSHWCINNTRSCSSQCTQQKISFYSENTVIFFFKLSYCNMKLLTAKNMTMKSFKWWEKLIWYLKQHIYVLTRLKVTKFHFNDFHLSLLSPIMKQDDVQRSTLHHITREWKHHISSYTWLAFRPKPIRKLSGFISRWRNPLECINSTLLI